MAPSLLVGMACIMAASAAEAADIFQTTNLLHIHISIPEEGMAALRRYRWESASRDQQDRPKVMASVSENGGSYTNVTVNLKGRFGSFRPIDDRPSLTLNFDKFAAGQKFYGLTKLSLNNSAQDPTCIHEKLSRELFAAAGVPTPRADFAVVALNDRELGLYVLTEGYSRQFLKQHFGNDDGNLYDAGHLEDVTQPLELDSGKGPRDHSDLKQLAAAAREPDPEKRFAALDQILDVDRFVSLVAMEVLLCHWDSYSMNRNNYRVYHDPATRKFVFMPHGIDQILGIDRANLDLPLFPKMPGLVARGVLTTPEGRKRYVTRIGTLFTNRFDPKGLSHRVREIDRKIRSQLSRPAERWPLRSEQPRAFIKTSGDHARDIRELCERISTRAEHLTRYFTQDVTEFPGTPVFDANGIAAVTDWKARSVTPGSRVAVVTNNGVTAFSITSTSSAATASWRRRFILPPGSYRLTGKARSTDGSSRPALRISGQPVPGSGQTGWANLRFDFDVRDIDEEVELVCELSNGPGTVLFDQHSLRLIRQP